MPIRAYLEGEFFDLELIKDMGIAFERVCKELGLQERDDSLNHVVGRAIIEKHRAAFMTRTIWSRQ
jgi:hypothetical protein